MFTLGINAVFHDSSACIIQDGKLLAAAEEERFTHVKHGKRPIPFSTYELPFHAIDYCLKIADVHINFVDHHIAHAVSAFYTSAFNKSAVMILDGRGERATSSYYMGEGNNLELIGEVCLPHSLGLLYEEVTSHLGFLRSSDEYKVMALA